MEDAFISSNGGGVLSTPYYVACRSHQYRANGAVATNRKILRNGGSKQRKQRQSDRPMRLHNDVERSTEWQQSSPFRQHLLIVTTVRLCPEVTRRTITRPIRVMGIIHLSRRSSSAQLRLRGVWPKSFREDRRSKNDTRCSNCLSWWFVNQNPQYYVTDDNRNNFLSY